MGTNKKKITRNKKTNYPEEIKIKVSALMKEQLKNKCKELKVGMSKQIREFVQNFIETK